MRHERRAGIARGIRQDEFTKKNGVKLGLMSFFIKACVEALKAVPVVNGRIEDDDFIQNNFYDIGVAVGTERGLVVPVVRDADKKSFAESGARHRRLRRQSARRKTEDRRFAGRHVHHHKRRRVRVAVRHADFKSAAKRHPRHAQNHAATGCRGRKGGSSPDDVSRPQLRSSRDRRKRSRHVSDQSEGVHRRSEKSCRWILNQSGKHRRTQTPAQM